MKKLFSIIIVIVFCFVGSESLFSQAGKLSADKLVISAPFGANYIWHLLAVSNIAYSSDYSVKYAKSISENDFKTLRDNTDLLRFSKETTGKLTFSFIFLPTYLGLDNEKDLQEYYDLLDAAYKSYSFSDFLARYDKIDWSDSKISLQHDFFFASSSDLSKKYDKSIVESVHQLSKIFKSNIPYYSDSIYSKMQAPSVKRITELNQYFLDGAYISKWEKTTDRVLSIDKFDVILLFAAKNGTDAINISSNKTAFYAFDDNNIIRDFVCHNIGRILLSDLKFKLKDVYDNDRQKFSNCIESMALYFNKRIIGKSRLNYELDFFDDFIYLNSIEKKFKAGKKIEEIITETLEEN
jgi:hypothetical protein